jgi:low affinity Fe/Cu permease
MRRAFDRFATYTAGKAGSSASFAAAVTILVVWAVTGPLLRFSNTWQLIINTGTTIVTFLMVFLVQHTQNKDNLAIHAKLDEIIRALDGAADPLIAIDEKPQDVVQSMRRSEQTL